jgi:DNA polymerase-1
MTEEKECLMIIDSNSVIHRAYHALPPLTTKKGEMVNAVYGFLLVFFKAIKEFHPDHIIAAFDLPFPTFRHEKFKEYKAKRPPAPKELYGQIPIIKEILKAFNVLILEKQGFEADDIIGTVSQKFSQGRKNQKREVVILSGDSDVLQLVNKNTKAFILRRGVKDTVLYDERLVKEKYQGLNPSQLDEYKALRGEDRKSVV